MKFIRKAVIVRDDHHQVSMVDVPEGTDPDLEGIIKRLYESSGNKSGAYTVYTIDREVLRVEFNREDKTTTRWY